MARERTPLTFGLGLDRATGKMAADPKSFVDLQQCYVAEEKLVFGLGLAGTWYPQFASETNVVGIFGLAATKDIIVVTFDITSRDTKVWRINPITAPTLQLVGTWATLDPASTFVVPRINAAESFGKLYLAHEEPTIGFRFVTQVYTPNAVDANVGAIANYTANLDGAGVANVKFAGVLAYNDALWGWGFGSASDQDRPEILRVSNPGDPDTMQAQALFYAGGRKSAITACVPVGSILAVRKRTEGYRIEGNSPGTYGIFPAEKGYGCEAARLAVTVGNDAWVWSHDGPRKLREDGSSYETGLALDLGGPMFTSLWVDTAKRNRLRYGFAIFEYTERILRFVFPGVIGDFDDTTTEFVCSLRDERARWSSGIFQNTTAGQGPGPRLICAANIVTDKANPPAIGGFTDQMAVTRGVAQNGRPAMNLSWRNNAARGDEIVRISIRHVPTATWRAIYSVPVLRDPANATPTQTVLLPPEFIAGDLYDFCIEYFRQGGTYSTPGDAGSKLLNQQVPAIADTLNSAMVSATWRRVSPVRHEVLVMWYISDLSVAQIVLQKSSTPIGPWADTATVVTTDERKAIYVASDAELRTGLYFRISARGSGPTTYEINAANPVNSTAFCFIGPTGTPTLRDYGWRVGAPNLVDLFIDSPSGANVLVVEEAVSVGTGWAELYHGAPDPSLLKILLGQADPASAPLTVESDPNIGDPILLEDSSLLTTEATHSLRLSAGFSTFGVTDFGPYTDVSLGDPSLGPPPNPVLSASSFPAGLIVRVQFAGGGSYVAGERIVGYFEWPSTEGDSVQRVSATVVTAGGADFDTVLPASARGQPVTYFYTPISTNRVINTGFAPAQAALGVCP